MPILAAEREVVDIVLATEVVFVVGWGIKS